ncbi:endolytic transglycosylase MltG [Streptococcus thoraltensis]|uniref:endolytic transglycosylase MltG n=1 Tax=Streptococcus thoraltensis TaxID=55085 RepID=UPI001F5AFE1D|nr:endolytic transglycosylase MltG [Streptococcus thoraltensis]
MTDFKDDDKSSSGSAENFKERILRELKEASRERQLQEEEAQRRDEENRQAAAAAEAARQSEKARVQREEELDRQAEKARRQKELELSRLAKERQRSEAARQAAAAAEAARQSEKARVQREEELDRQAEKARRQKELELSRLAKERQRSEAARQAAAAAETARQSEKARVQREEELEQEQQKALEQERLVHEAAKMLLASSETTSQMPLSFESQDNSLGENDCDSATNVELADPTSHQKQSDVANFAMQTQELQSETISSSETVTKKVAPDTLSEQSQIDLATSNESSTSRSSLSSSVALLTEANTDETDIATSETVTEADGSGESIEEQNEAVVAQVEARESITEERQSSMNRKKKNHKIAAKIAGILVTIILVVGLLTAFLGYRYVSSSLGAVDAGAKKFVTVQIPKGSGNKLIGQILEENGLIKNASIFNYYTRFKNVSNLQSGYYNLQKSMTVEEIIDTLKQGGTAEPQEPVSGKILVTEGFTIDQIAKAVTTNVNTKKVGKTPYSEKDFLNLMKNKDFIDKMVKKYPELLKDIPSADKARYQLEGYLFPATYNYYEESTLEDVVDQMLATMNTNLAPYYEQIAAKGQTVNEVLTLASLVEKEGSTDEDRRNIASVFYNRLNTQMPLQSNIAILYAMGKLGQETTLREDAAIDTKIKSPYNIYENPGLMPGPVDSPGLSAIEATVNPANTDNLYFVADVTTGEVYYAEDYATHEANVSKYVNAHLDK